MDESEHTHTHAASSGTGGGAVTKSGTQLLHELLAIAYHVFEEAKHMNLKPPLQPSSRMFALDALAPPPSGTSNLQSPPRSPAAPDSPSDDTPSVTEMNGTSSAHGHHTSLGLHPVIPYSHDEIQDSFTRMATLRNQYTKISCELLDVVKKEEARRQRAVSAPAGSEDASIANEKERIEKLVERRNQLRKEVYERNLVMKGLIDRLRHLQYSMRMIRGGSTSSPQSIVMESV